ncbi:hypothetical protein F5887DRAFT_1072873 [Amanita rubescens]|nr:hypothetical protein F5887DRAFT_1091187 [Amanita rubescens]KAF8346780.1 hypothetical protein F5887DRAFT_1072873 [Amanita rubescens]
MLSTTNPDCSKESVRYAHGPFLHLSYIVPLDGNDPPRLPQAQKKKKQPKSTSISSHSLRRYFPLHHHLIYSSTDPFQAIHSTKASLTAQTNTLRRSSLTPRTFHCIGTSRITRSSPRRDMGGVVDEDEDGDYSDEGEGDDIDNDGDCMGGAAGYWKDGIKERWEALKARRPNAYDSGVEGEWRSVACWMDYQDLLLHSVSTNILSRMRGTTFYHPFCSQELANQPGNEDDINEAIWLFPITLCTTRHSPPPRPTPFSSTPIQDESADLKAGESKLAEEGNRMQPPIGKLKGTVKIIGDRAILWTMTSSYVEQDDPEWVVNGVQIGCIGDAEQCLFLFVNATTIDVRGL